MDKYDRRPCDPPLAQDVKEWASRRFPDDEYIKELYKNFLQNFVLHGPPRRSAGSTFAPFGPFGDTIDTGFLFEVP